MSRSTLLLMLPTGDPPKPGAEAGMIVITPEGYRALADAMDAGLVTWRPDWAAIRAARNDHTRGRP